MDGSGRLWNFLEGSGGLWRALEGPPAGLDLHGWLVCNRGVVPYKTGESTWSNYLGGWGLALLVQKLGFWV